MRLELVWKEYEEVRGNTTSICIKVQCNGVEYLHTCVVSAPEKPRIRYTGFVDAEWERLRMVAIKSVIEAEKR